MANIELTLACEDYDRTRALKDGLVKPEGIDLNYVALPVEEIFWRMLHFQEFDAAEMSMGAYHVDASRGHQPFIAIPVFPPQFRHRLHLCEHRFRDQAGPQGPAWACRSTP